MNKDMNKDMNKPNRMERRNGLVNIRKKFNKQIKYQQNNSEYIRDKNNNILFDDDIVEYLGNLYVIVRQPIPLTKNSFYTTLGRKVPVTELNKFKCFEIISIKYNKIEEFSKQLIKVSSKNKDFNLYCDIICHNKMPTYEDYLVETAKIKATKLTKFKEMKEMKEGLNK